MTAFSPDQPAEGARTLLEWARNAVEVRHGTPLPDPLTETGLPPFLRRLEFAGPRLRTALHFALAAVASREESAEDGFFQVLDRSLGERPEFPGQQDAGTLEMIALGIALDPRTISWLDRGASYSSDSMRELSRLVIGTRQRESVTRLIDCGRENDGISLLKDMASECAVNGLTRESLDILRSLPPEALDEKYFGDFRKYRLGRFSAEEEETFYGLLPEGGATTLTSPEIRSAEIERLVDAGKIEEAETLLDQETGEDRWRFSNASSRLAVAEMESGRFEKGLEIYQRFGSGIFFSLGLGRKWTEQFLDRYDLDQAVAMALRLPHAEEGSSRPVVAQVLLARGEIEKAEELASGTEDDGEKCAVLLALAKAARSFPEYFEPVEKWLNETEILLAQIPEQDSLYEEFHRGSLPLQRNLCVEHWHRGNRERLEDFSIQQQARHDQIIAEGDPDEEAEYLLLAIALGWADTRQFDRLMPMIEQLGQKDFIGEISSAVFEKWNPESDCETILGLCQDPEDYYQKRFLISMAHHLAEKGDPERARHVATHLRDRFEEDDGFELIAEVLRDRGDYEEARQCGGAPGRRRYWAGDSPREFEIGKDDSEARDWITSVKDWDQNGEWLFRIGCHGRPRDSVEGLLRCFLRHHHPRWLTDEESEPNPNLPQDFSGICRRAKEEAKYRVWREGKGPAPRTPFSISVLIWKLEIVSWILDRFAGTSINAWEKRFEREQELNKGTARRKLAKEVPAALKLPPGEERRKILCQLGDEVSRYDELSAPGGLVEGLREEAARLQPGIAAGDFRERHDRLEQLNQLAVAMLRAGDGGGAARAWTEYSKWREPEEWRIRELAEQVRCEDWHLAAPFCSASPLAAAILAAKLARWYPKEKIRIG